MNTVLFAPLGATPFENAQQLALAIDQRFNQLNRLLTPVFQSGSKISSILQIAAETIPDNSITTPKLVDDAITQAKIAANAVAVENIIDGAITDLKIANNAVTEAKVAANAITGVKILDGAIESPKIAAGTITSDRIAAGTIQGDRIAALTITAGNIAALAITAGKIAANAVTATEITAGAITTSKLAAGAVTANEIAAGAVTAAKITVGSLSAISANIGAITAGTITGVSITTDVGTIAGFTLNPGKFTAGTGANYVELGNLGGGYLVFGSILTGPSFTLTHTGLSFNSDTGGGSAARAGLQTVAHAGLLRLWNSSAAVTITGDGATGVVTATSFSGSGAALTGLTKGQVGLSSVVDVDQTNASNITSGTLADARLPASIYKKLELNPGGSHGEIGCGEHAGADITFASYFTMYINGSAAYIPFTRTAP